MKRAIMKVELTMERDAMIVITRNGKTEVITGWRAWLYGAAALLLIWSVFMTIAAVFVGVAISVGVMMLLMVPALAIVAMIGRMMRR